MSQRHSPSRLPLLGALTSRLVVALAMLLSAAANPAFAAPVTTSGADLALRWPSLLGQTVRLRLTLVRALDVMRYHATADATDVVLTLPPGKVWSGQQFRCATVLGPAQLHQHGRTEVVGLLWTPCRGR